MVIAVLRAIVLLLIILQGCILEHTTYGFSVVSQQHQQLSFRTKNAQHRRRIIRKQSPTTNRKNSVALYLSSSDPSLVRRGVEIPLLDLSPEFYKEFIQPLPSSHLPVELSTINVYGMEISRPAHKMVIEDAITRSENVLGGEVVTTPNRVFGHVAYKPSADTLVGAIGCASEVLIRANAMQQQSQNTAGSDSSSQNNMPPDTVLCRGSYRFIVREIKQTIPFAVAIVDELVDEEPGTSDSGVNMEALITAADEDDDEDDDDDDDDDDEYYANLSASELVQRTLVALKQYVDNQLQSVPTELSLLEQSIIEDAGSDPNLEVNAQRQAVEEMAAVFEIFQGSLVDLCPMPIDRYYAIGMMAAEMTNLPNRIRQQCLTTTDGLVRLKLVLKELDEIVGMAKARQMAKSITKKDDEDERELQIGQPTLPPWAKQIQKGTRLEYFWNEEWGWCPGEVVEEPMLIVDEIILTVYFEEDGTTHRIPFSAEDKVRWRPASPK